MKLNEVNEKFGYFIDFEKIRGIDQVSQPGILDPNTLFNVDALAGSLENLAPFSDAPFQVYFRNINLTIKDPKKNKNWWDLFRRFEAAVRNGSVEYWYEDGDRGVANSIFDSGAKPYQSFIKLFDGALQGFSCFIHPHDNRIDFSSYRNFESQGNYVPGEVSLWEGSKKDLIGTALAINSAFRDMRFQGCTVDQNLGGLHRQEIRIISDAGALVGSLYGQSSVTLLVKRKQLEKIVD